MALHEVSKHSIDLSQIVIDSGAIPYLTQLINHHDLQLKKQVCQTLASIAKHSADMAESVVGAELFPRILYKLKEND